MHMSVVANCIKPASLWQVGFSHKGKAELDRGLGIRARLAGGSVDCTVSKVMDLQKEVLGVSFTV